MAMSSKDADRRDIKPPADFVKALKAAPPAWEQWQDLSYSHQREHVEAIQEAKKPETRARRIDWAIRQIQLTPKRKR
jgi:uncharacterized protein YdeI (YjbR/CyaY-like superfamily)